MPASRAFCALRWPMSNSHPGLGLRGTRTELTALDRLLAEARAGQSRVLVLRGEGESARQRCWITRKGRRLVFVWENREILSASRRPGLPLCTYPLGLPRTWLRLAAQGNRKA